MSKIKALEKLRKNSHLDDNKWTLDSGEVVYVYGSDMGYNDAINWGEQWREIADEIESEIAERFMELPVDADGVPIRIGDTVCEVDVSVPIEVRSLTFYEDYVDVNVCGMNPNMLRHVEPRTLESILCDALADVSCMGDGIVRTFKPDEPYVAEVAAEIRELLGVSE